MTSCGRRPWAGLAQKALARADEALRSRAHPRWYLIPEAGTAEGRSDGLQLTLFDATGLALQDLATAELAARFAEERKVGRTIHLD